MKQSLKITVGTLVLASALIACGKKGGSSAAAPVASATSGCVINAQGSCVNTTGGYLTRGQGKARIRVSNVEKYRQFLMDNGMCSGPMNIAVAPGFRRTGVPCVGASNYFDVHVQAVDEGDLPRAINFDVRAFFPGLVRNGYLDLAQLSGHSMTQAEIDGLSNGYVITFNRFGGGFGNGIQPFIRPGFHRPIPVQQTIAPTQNTLTVVLASQDATGTIFQAVVSYQGVQIGVGTFRGSFNNGQLAYGATGAPTTLPMPYGSTGRDNGWGYSSAK